MIFKLLATQPAVEAAKIAAETASHNATIAAYVAGGTAIIALSGTIITSVNSSKIAKKTSLISKEIGEKNVQSLEKRRLIDTISSQRIEWINSIRREFVEFNKLSHTYSMRHYVARRVLNDNQNLDFGELYQDMVAAKNHIELLLNPQEIFSTKLTIELNKIMDSLHVQEFVMKTYVYHKENAAFIQQVILKAEWKRIKEETARGEQISKEEMNEFFEEISKEIDSKKYNNLFS